MKRVVVVGAGFGGLSAAIELAASGAEVTVVEALDRAGGKAGVTQVDGVTIDTGPSVLTMPEVFDSVFRTGGSSLMREVELVTTSPGFRYLWPDGAVVDVHHDIADTVSSVRRSLGSDAARDLTGFLGYSRDIWEAASPHFVYGPAPSVGTLLSLGTRGVGAFAKIDSLRTMRSAIRGRVRDPHLAMLLERYATYNGSDPRKAPATLNCIAHVEMAEGWYGVAGGIEALVRALVSVAERNGVRFLFGARVERIDVARRWVRGVTLEGGETIAADAVVANADVAHVRDSLLEPRRKRALNVPQERSMSGYTLALRARRRGGGERVAHTVYFPEDYEAEFRDVFENDRPPTSPTLYVCAQERAHRREGWAEDEPLFVMANAPPEPVSGPRPADVWRELEARMRERLLEGHLVEPSDPIVWRRSPSDLAREFPDSRGAIYGGSSNGKTAAFSRPENRLAKLPGLYLASGGAHPGGGMPLCVLSGRAAADAVRSDLRLAREQRKPHPRAALPRAATG